MNILIARIIYGAIDIYTWILVVYCIFTWVPAAQGGVLSDIRKALGKICDPLLNLFRKFIPPLGGMVDITPIVALLVLQFAARIIVNILV